MSEITRIAHNIMISPSSLGGGLGVRQWHGTWQLCGFTSPLPGFTVHVLAESSSREALERELARMEADSAIDPYGELKGNRLHAERNREMARRNADEAHANELSRLEGEY